MGSPTGVVSGPLGLIMTVKELILELQKCDQSKVVIISVDEEGNHFEPIRSVSGENNAFNENRNRGDYDRLGLEYLTPEEEKLGYSDEDVIDGVPAVVLWP